MSGVFISYRRDDCAGHAGRLYDRLSARFGKDQIFLDTDAIHLGDDFARVIRGRISSCDALIALIGPGWKSSIDGKGGNRLDDPNDFVRIEIGAALEQGARVIPVLIEGTTLPQAEELPPELSRLIQHQALELNHAEFDHDVAWLIQVLEKEVFKRRTKTSRIVKLLMALLLAVAATTGLWWYQKPHFETLDGRWRGQPHPSGQVPYSISFRFESAGGKLLGTVSYPTGDGRIENGEVKDGKVYFVTRHVPQFMDAEAEIRFEGTIRHDIIEFIMQHQGGTTRFTAARESN